ncbi:hypothetical protein L209DRAFT_752995 [Thermothelomyces heterothallicus CBS 203.75]
MEASAEPGFNRILALYATAVFSSRVSSGSIFCTTYTNIPTSSNERRGWTVPQTHIIRSTLPMQGPVWPNSTYLPDQANPAPPLGYEPGKLSVQLATNYGSWPRLCTTVSIF